jgi:transcriptional regulator with XRE-family HTH domain
MEAAVPQQPSPPLKGDRVADRVVAFMKLTGLSQSAFGKRIGDSGYQLIYSWKKDLRKPSVRKLNRVVALAKSLGYSYTLDSFMAGTDDEQEVLSQDDGEDAAPAAGDELDRAAALVWIDDREGLSPEVRERMRAMLRKYPQRSWKPEYLADVAEQLEGFATDLQAHRAAEAARLDAEVAGEKPIDVTVESDKTPTASQPPPPRPSRKKKRSAR